VTAWGDSRDSLPAPAARSRRRLRATRVPADGDTCHIDVIDKWGNVVAATPSGGWLQSSPVVPGLGFCLGTRGQMFWLEEGLPTSLKPGSRPRTTLTPSMATRPERRDPSLRLARRRQPGPVDSASSSCA